MLLQLCRHTPPLFLLFPFFWFIFPSSFLSLFLSPRFYLPSFLLHSVLFSSLPLLSIFHFFLLVSTPAAAARIWMPQGEDRDAREVFPPLSLSFLLLLLLLCLKKRKSRRMHVSSSSSVLISSSLQWRTPSQHLSFTHFPLQFTCASTSTSYARDRSKNEVVSLHPICLSHNLSLPTPFSSSFLLQTNAARPFLNGHGSRRRKNSKLRIVSAVFERFTERAIKAVIFSQREAKALGRDMVFSFRWWDAPRLHARNRDRILIGSISS